MPVINVNLIDTFEQWRIKTNNIGNSVGDLELLTTTAKDDVISAVNEINNTVTNAVGTVVENDTAPKLGGNLSLNSNDIDGTGNINITGNIIGTIVVGGDLSGTVDNAQIVSNAILTDKIADDAVTESKIADDAVTESKIADDAVTESKIADDAVGTSQIITGSIVDSKLNTSGTLPAWDGSQLINLPSALSENSVTTTELANDAVETLNIKDGNVTSDKIADDAVTNNKIANDAVTVSKIADNAVTETKIADNAVTETKIANNAVGITQLSVQTDGNSGDILSTDGSGVLSFIPISVPTGGIVNHKYVSLTGFHSDNGNYTAPAPDENVAPLITQGFEFMAMNYTPTDTNNTLRIFTDIWGGAGSGGTVYVFTTWITDTVTNNVTLINSRGYQTAVSQNTGDVTMLGWFKPTTTNQLRISFRLGGRNGGPVHINSSSSIDHDYGSGEDGRGESSISVQEYSGQNLGSNITAPGQTG